MDYLEHGTLEANMAEIKKQQQNPTEINSELRKYINEYFKEYHIKDCLVILPASITSDYKSLLLPDELNSKYIIKHISSTPSTEGLRLSINIVSDTDTSTLSNLADANKDKLLDSGRLNELIGEYMTRLANLVEQSTSREPKPAAAWKHRNFLSSISHQIKTPLSAIFSGTKLIKHYTDNEHIDRICEYMNQSCVELTRYMNDIIDFYYLKQGVLLLEKNQVNISDIVDYVYANYQLQCQDLEIGFEKIISPDVPNIIICDELRLTQIMMNLMDNAVKFTSHPEVIDIQGQTTDINRVKKISIQVYISSNNADAAESSTLIIQVLDNGIGTIDIMNQESYFQPFNQTNRNWLNAPDGIGLGLCLSRDFARKMGGDLSFVSPSSKNKRNINNVLHLGSLDSMTTCIELKLPLSRSAECYKKVLNHPKVSINPDPTVIITTQPTEIVLIDDNQTNIELLTLTLEQLGYNKIKSFTNSITGQKYISDFNQQIACAIIDIRMPRKNGFDLIGCIADKCRNIHFILLTALRQDDIRDQFTNIKSKYPETRISLLFKPIDCTELQKILLAPPNNPPNPDNKLKKRTAYV